MKIAGILLIISASVFSALCYERKAKEKLCIMEILIDFISYIKSQISYFSLPIDSIYSKYSSNKAEIAEIKKGNYSSLKNFNENIRTETISFFESIGKGFKTEQISKCEILITNLTNELTALKADTKNKIKIFRAISLFISVCIIIFIV